MIASRAATFNPAWLWLGMLSGPVAWFVHLNVIYSLVDFGCHAGLASRELLGANLIVALLLLATLIALAIPVVGGLVAYRNWRDLEAQNALDRTEERQHFMAFVGTVLSAGFAAVIVLTAIPAFVLSTCGGIIG